MISAARATSSSRARTRSGRRPACCKKDGSGTLTLTGANTYGSTTTVNQGTLTVSGNGTLGSGTGALIVNNNNTGAATATVVNLSTTLDTTTGSLSGTIATASSGTNTATINTGGAGRGFTVNQTAAGNYAGTIAGAGNFALGTGSTSTLTLSGANTYTGTTTVSAGTLLVTGSTAAASAVTVGNSAGTLTGTLGGTGTVGGTVLVNSGSILSAGAGNTPGTLTTGMLTLTTGSTFNAVLLNDTSISQLAASGTTDLSQAAFSVTLAPGAAFALANNGTTDVLTLITSGGDGKLHQRELHDGWLPVHGGLHDDARGVRRGRDGGARAVHVGGWPPEPGRGWLCVAAAVCAPLPGSGARRARPGAGISRSLECALVTWCAEGGVVTVVELNDGHVESQG